MSNYAGGLKKLFNFKNTANITKANENSPVVKTSLKQIPTNFNKIEEIKNERKTSETISITTKEKPTTFQEKDKDTDTNSDSLNESGNTPTSKQNIIPTVSIASNRESKLTIQEEYEVIISAAIIFTKKKEDLTLEVI